MNKDLQLQLLAYVDGELSKRQVRRLENLIAGDGEAQALVAELQMTKNLLAGYEVDARVPEAHDFYWSKIERAILQQEAAGGRGDGGFHWRKLFAPLAGLAAVVVLGFLGLRFNDYALLGQSVGQLAEVETESEHMGSFSFRSQSGNMFVVWVYDRTPDTETEPEVQPVLDDDLLIQ